MNSESEHKLIHLLKNKRIGSEDVNNFYKVCHTVEEEEMQPMGFKCIHSSKIKLENMEESGAEGIRVRWLIKKDDGAPNFAMRLFELQPKGHSPIHSHNWEHEVYILEGNCKVTCEGQEEKASAGYVVFIPPNAKHQFANVGKSTLKFLCLVPHHK